MEVLFCAVSSEWRTERPKQEHMVPAWQLLASTCFCASLKGSAPSKPPCRGILGGQGVGVGGGG